MVAPITRTLIDRLFIADGEPRTIDESVAHLGSVNALADVDSIVDVDPRDGSVFAALHLLEGRKAMHYTGIHASRDLFPIAESNRATFTTLNGLHERLTERGHAKSITRSRRREAVRELKASVARYSNESNVSLTYRTPIERAEPIGRAAIIGRTRDDDRGGIARTRLLPVYDHARLNGFELASFSVPIRAIPALPSSYASVVETGPDRVIVSYVFEPKRTMRSVSLEGNLFENLLGVYGSQVD